MMQPYELSAAEAADAIRRKELSPVDLVQSLLSRIKELDSGIKSWQTVDEEGALNAARLCAKQAGSERSGPLHGVPLGIKDVFHVAGLPTTWSSPIFMDYVPRKDATSVARLKAAGGIILGKTVTVAFAHFDPPPTRNPWNLERTPGGSSSGSAAAVAARMIPAAIGSQTGGSVVRPAGYCGVVGVKPTYGRISRYGAMPDAWSTDHVGALARTVEDAALLTQVMSGQDTNDLGSSPLPVGDYLAAARKRDRAPRLGFVVDEENHAAPEMAAHLKEVAARFEAAGAEVREVRLPSSMALILALRGLIGHVEMGDVHGHLQKQRPEGYPRKITDLVQAGQLIPGVAYIHAQRLRHALRLKAEKMFEGVDCLLMPSITSEAPDPSTTGDNWFQSPWSLFGFPAISLPSGLGAERLPLAIQLVAAPYQEETLFSAAAWAEQLLGPMPNPC